MKAAMLGRRIDFREEQHPRGQGGQWVAKPGVDADVSDTSGSGLPEYLTQVADMKTRMGYKESVEQWQLDNGREFRFDSSSFKGGTPHECYKNAAMAALSNPDMTYVEGYVSVHGVPIQHAWMVDKSGKVVDPTIGEGGRGIQGYFGVPIKQDFLTERLLKAKVYGLLAGKPKDVLATLNADPAKVVAQLPEPKAPVRPVRRKKAELTTPRQVAKPKLETVYHASADDISEFRPDAWRRATFFATTPEGAERGAGAGARERMGDQPESRARPRRTIAVDLDTSRIAGLEMTPVEQDWWRAQPQRIEGEAGLDAAMHARPKSLRGWYDVYDEQNVDGAFVYTKRPIPSKSLAEVNASGRDVYGSMVGGYSEGSESAMSERMRASGMAGFLVSDEAGVSVAVTDPSALRIRKQAAPKVPPARAFTGQPIETSTTLSKLEQGALGESIVVQHLKEQGINDARLINTTQPNYPVDVAGDHMLVEVKTGLVSNSKDAQQWRATIGRPGKAEREWLKTASPEEKLAANNQKRRDIIDRKNQVLDTLEARTGVDLNAKTFAVIIDPDRQVADIYEFDGFHNRIGWNSDMAKQGFVRTIAYGDKVEPLQSDDLPGLSKDPVQRRAQLESALASLAAESTAPSRGNWQTSDFRHSQNINDEELRKLSDTFNSLPPEFTEIARKGRPPGLYRNITDDPTNPLDISDFTVAYYSPTSNRTVYYQDKLADDYTRVVAHELGHQWDRKTLSIRASFNRAYDDAVRQWGAIRPKVSKNATDFELLQRMRRDDYYLTNSKEAWAAATEMLVVPDKHGHSPELVKAFEESGILRLASRFYTRKGVPIHADRYNIQK